jgi:hypothetical protein
MQPGPSAYIAVAAPEMYVSISPYGSEVRNGQQFDVYAPGALANLQTTSSQHDRVECCVMAYWHSCTEWQEPRLGPLAPALSG